MTISVLTFHRPEQIRETVQMLHEQLDDVSEWADVEVLVIDNDPEGSAREAVTALGLDRVRYVVEPTPGISAGRNRALAETVGRDALLFMDDDGRPGEGWLRLMLERWRESGAVAVAGWVDTRYLGEPDPWIVAGGFFERERFADGVERPAAACGNLLLDRRAVGELRFNSDLGLAGGEDTLLTRTLVARGGRIVFCRDAVVVDLVAIDRLSRNWVLMRKLSHGNSSGLLDMYFSSSPLARAKVLVQGLGRCVVGLAKATVARRDDDPTRHARAMRLASRGAGMALAGLGLSWNEYSTRPGRFAKLVKAPASLRPGGFEKGRA